MRQISLILLLVAASSVSAQVRTPIFKQGDWSYSIENDSNNRIKQFVVDPRTGKIVSPTSQGTGQYIVKFSSTASGQRLGSIQDYHAQFEREWNDASARQRASGGASQPAHRIRFSYRRAFNGKAITASEDFVNELRRLPYVASIVEDKVVKASDATSNAQIRAEQTWSQFGLSGQGVVIGIIDTGIDYGHIDLGGGFGPAHKVIGGYDFVNEDSDPMDDHGHGTHVAGIAAGIGTHKGVAPGAKLIAFKALDQNGSGYDSWILAAIERTLDPDQDPNTDDKLDVVNMSLGRFPDPEEPLSEAVNNAVAQGVVFVVAAGNDGVDGSVGSPGIAANAITVGAVDQYDVLTGFSSRGPGKGYSMKPDVSAPGDLILSTLPGNTEAAWSGTSMASPHVAGAAALLLEKNPTWTPEVVKSVLMETADDAASQNHPVATAFEAGTGRINVLSAAEAGIAVTPGSISLGMVDKSQPLMSRSYVLKVMNLSGSSKTYSLALSGDLTNASVTSSVSPDAFTLEAGAVQEVTLSISINTATLPSLTYPNAYVGYVEATSGSETMKATVAFMNHDQFILNLPGELPGMVALFNTTGWPYTFKFVTPAPQVTLDLPANTYEVVANYGTSIVAKSNVTLPTVSELTIEKTDAIYRLDFVPRDENAVALPSGLAGNTAFNVVINYNGLWTLYMEPLPTLYVSALPPDYVVDFAVNDFKSAGSDRFYSVVETAVGVSQDRVLENAQAQMTRINFPRHFEPEATVGITSFFATSNVMSWTNEPRIGSADFQYWYARRDKRSKVRFVAHSLDIDPKFGFGYQLPTINLYTNDSLSFHGGWLQGELEHRHFSGRELTYMLGHSPLYWSANTYNSANEILILGSQHLSGYFRQGLGDYQRGTVTYKIKDAGNSVIKEGSVVNVLQADQMDWENIEVQANSFIRADGLTPGEYKAEFQYNDYHVRGTPGHAKVELTMRTDQLDPNPPYIDRLTIIQNNISTDSLILGQEAELRYSFIELDPVGIVSWVVKIRNTINGDWIDISPPVGSSYSILPDDLTPGPYKLYVEVADPSGNKMKYEASPAFLVGPVLNSAPFVKPLIIAPADGATTSVHPGFVWSKATGITSYRLQVSKAEDFSVVDHELLHNGVSTGFPFLFDDFTQYYCRVRIETDTGWGPWADVKSFTTGSGAVYRMTLAEPPDGKMEQTSSTTFKWRRNADQTIFVFQVARDANFTEIVAEKTTSDTTQTLVMEDPLHNYYWRVRPLTDFVFWSDPFDFTTRDAIITVGGPANHSAAVGYPATFTWNCEPPPQQVEIEMWKSDDTSAIISESLPGTATSFTLEGLNLLTTYTWRVKAIYSEMAKYSDEYIFTTRDAIVEQLFPADDAVDAPLDITLKWHLEPLPAQTTVEISTSPDFDVLLSATSANDSSAFVDDLALDTKYYWRVRANYGGVIERVSATRTFTTIVDTRVFLTSPANGAVDVDLPTALAWTTVAGFGDYQVELSLTEGFSVVYRSIHVSGGQVSIPSIRPNTKFYWRVSIDDPDYPQNWSAVSSFTSTNLVVTLLFPAHNSVDVSKLVTFRWTATISSSYRLEVASDQAFNSIVITNVTSGDSATVGLEYNTTYFWRVTADFESVSGTSVVNSFTVLNPAPRLLAPENHAANLPPAFVLSWTGVDGVSGYIVDVSDNPTFTNSTQFVAPAPATALAMTGLPSGKMYYWKIGIDLSGKRYWSETFDFSTEPVTSVEDDRVLWTVSPNPAKTQVVIALPDGPHQIEIHNSLGQAVWQHRGTSSETTWQWDANSAAPADGIYVVTLRHGGELKVVKVLIAK